LRTLPFQVAGFRLNERLMAGWLLVAFCALCCTVARAGSLPEFDARVWQTEEGLPHNIVQAITQTRDGFLWAGTHEGVARFDGVSFTPLELTPGASQPSVTSLCEGQDGSLWLGTEKSGLYRLRNGTLSHYGRAEGLESEAVTQVRETRDGTLWIGLPDGVALWRDGRIQFPAASGLTTNAVLSLCVAPDGNLWIGASRGLQAWRDQKVGNYREADGVPLRAIRGLCNDADGGLWIGRNGGLSLMKAGTFTHYGKGSGPAGIVTSVLRDGLGNLWVGSFGGLSRFVDGKFINESREDGAAYAVHALFEDREGTVWVGFEDGLARLLPKRFVTYTRQQGLARNAIASVCAGRDGGIWIGTWGGGLTELINGQTNTYGRTNGLTSNFVVAMNEAPDGSFWVGTEYGQGINRLKGGTVTAFPTTPGQLGFMITALLEDQQGHLWVGSRDGLTCFTAGEAKRYREPDGLGHHWINALWEQPPGTLWIGTEAGLTRWRNGSFTNNAINGPFSNAAVLSLYGTRDGGLWIGTRGAGLGRLKAGKLDTFTSQQGLYSDSILAILEDDQDRLWLNSNKGIFRVSRRELEAVASGACPSFNSISYAKADGIISGGQYWEAAKPTACKGTDGRLWFETTQGVAVVDPSQVTANERPPPVVIEQVIANRKVVPSPRSKVQSQGARSAALELGPETLEIAPGRGEVEIHYTALSLRAPEKNRFKYQLERVDLDWVEAGGRRVAYYNNLAPGRYTFRVIACNNDGVWNETGASVRLRLQPHLWQTWWFLSLCGVVATGAIGGGARYVTWRKMQRQLERLEQQHAVEKERARIARDMHDELGAKLTHISFQGAMAQRSLANPAEAAQRIGKMAQTARALVGSLDEIVWAVDPANDSLENLANYICRYAGEFFENSPIACEFSIPANLPDRRLSADVRHNVFLAVKEALSNVLKHSQAAHVQIRLATQANEFEILISDDGRGFTPGTSGKNGRAGHGLGNIRDRLALLKGGCQVESEVGKGTHLKLVVPLGPGPGDPARG
jgi:ligand-binding sensor domain-containing protein/signal transduction histidine kinase